MPSVSFVTALQDNYIWIILSDNRRHAIVIDPGVAEPVRLFLQRQGLQLSAILLTHHHPDHINGVADLVAHYRCPVYGMHREELPWISHTVNDHNKILVENFHFALEVISVPGHTRDHVAYYHKSALFCGDTIFAGGCGRLFEGTARQLFESINLLSRLPDDTRIYCAHEYTQNNLQFAQLIEPDNAELIHRLSQTRQLRQQKLPTVPSSLKVERQTNPFLRCHLAQVRKRVAELTDQPLANSEITFARLRRLKDQWHPA